ncbi:hypothetical protein Hanom_Chr06g00556391 [Helianthus anomalus]
MILQWFASASKVLQETCNYVRSLHREVDDLSDRLSQLLSTIDSQSPEASIIQSLLIKLQVLSFMFTPNCRRCPLAQKLTSSVLNVSKSYTLCPLGQTQLDFFVKSGHVP